MIEQLILTLTVEDANRINAERYRAIKGKETVYKKVGVSKHFSIPSDFCEQVLRLKIGCQVQCSASNLWTVYRCDPDAVLAYRSKWEGDVLIKEKRQFERVCYGNLKEGESQFPIKVAYALDIGQFTIRLFRMGLTPDPCHLLVSLTREPNHPNLYYDSTKQWRKS